MNITRRLILIVLLTVGSTCLVSFADDKPRARSPDEFIALIQVHIVLELCIRGADMLIGGALQAGIMIHVALQAYR